ncbi:unnamed protein product [Staurois parvus]|uniref:Uncharacterized protein n=1 Tax=Staurois parvus TaxID=386267 RepID=A0ABN9EPH7_9NEOB|nr:unnamed protein product [Staurois parvus]
MHSPKEKKKSLAIHTKLSMRRVTPIALYYQQMDWGQKKDQTAFLHNAED